MNFLKRTTLAVFLGMSTITGSVFVATPALATTAADVQELIAIRVAQLQALIAEQNAIINGASTPAQIIEAQATKQRILFRIAQLTAIDGAAETLPEATLEFLENYLQTVISAA